MPTPNFDAVLTAMREPGFFPETRARTTAAAQGAAYADKLKEAFDARSDKQAVESALNLTFFGFPTDATRKKRDALRAVLAAEMLMKKRLPTEVPNLRKLHETQQLDGLRRTLVNLFPLSGYDPKRMYWNPEAFTEPILLPDLRIQQSWEGKSVPKYMFLVHVNDDPEKPIWQDPVTELAKYSGSSFTVMSNEKPYVYNSIPQGIIFRVPINNILVTHNTDLMTALHLGSVHTVGKGGRTYAEEILELITATSVKSGGVEAPTTLLKRTAPPNDTPTVGIVSRYNEVVVCGKPDVPLPWGVTGKLKVAGFFMLMTKGGTLLQAYDAPKRLKAMQKHSDRIGRPLLFLPNAP